MLGLGFGVTKGGFVSSLAKTLYRQYVARVTAAGGVFQNAVCALNRLLSLNSKGFLKDASWVLIPDGIKEDIVFAEKPTDGIGDLGFTRASDATYTDSTGVVRRSPYNLVTFSGDFTNAIWTKGNVTFSSGLLTGSAGTSFKNIQQANTQNGQQVIYFDVQYVSHRFVQILLGTPAADTMFCNFDLLNKTVTSQQNGGVGAIQDFGSYLRISMAFTSTSKLSVFLALVDTSNAGRAASSASTGSVGLLRSQLNEGTSALDYFPTTNRQDVPRIDFRNADGTLSSCGRLLLEPQRTNEIRNSSMVGAVAGSPGQFPSTWTNTNGGLTRTVVGIGTENGLPYIDVRFNGTTTGVSVDVGFEGTSSIAAATGQTWTQSLYFKTITSQPNSFQLHQFEYNNVGGFVTQANQSFSPTATLQRFTWSRAMAGATTAFVYPFIRMNVTNGAAYDFTIRIAAPQMELGAYATTWVPTTTAAVTRIADTFTRNNIFTNGLISAAGGTWFIEFDNNVVYSDGITQAQLLGLGNDAVGATANNIFLSCSSGTRLRVWKQIAGTLSSLYLTTTNRTKLAIRWNGTTMDIFENGVKVVTATSFTPTSLQTLRTIATQHPYNISQSALAPTPLSDDQCEVLTSEGYGNYALLAESLNCVLQ